VTARGPRTPEGPAASRRRLVAAVALLFGAELAAARITSAPLPVADVAASAGLLALAALPAFLLLARGPRTGLAAAATGAAAFLPLALVAGGLVGVARMQALGPTTPEAAQLALAAAGSLVLAGALRARRGGNPAPGPVWVVGTLAAAAAVTWVLRPGGLPPAGMVAALAGTWALLAALSVRSWGAPAVALAAAAIACVPLGAGPAAPVRWTARGPAPSGPDLFLLTVDTLRADRAAGMRAYRRLAERGVAFSAAQAPSPWTLPSMASLLTGRPVDEHDARKVEEGYQAVSPSVTTLAERLARRGYDTAAVVARNDFLGAKFGFGRGFAVFDHVARGHPFALPRLPAVGPARPVLVDLAGFVLRGRRAVADADLVVERARRVLRRRRERPLFLWVHFFDPHLPYRHLEDTGADWPRRLALNRRTARWIVMSDPFWATPQGRRALTGAYDVEVDRVDRALVRLLDHVERHGRADRVVALTADHGEELYDHGRFEHGHALYQEVAAVPLAVAGLEGGRPPGSVEETPVDLLDLAATLLAAAGVPDPELPGRDLARPLPPRALVTRSLLYPEASGQRAAVREGRWKAIAGEGGLELYDLRADPRERRNLAASRPELAERLGAAAEAPAERLGEGQPVRLDPAERAALRALGYVTE